MDDNDIYERSMALRAALRWGLGRAAVTGCSAFTLADARRFGLHPNSGQVIFNGVRLDEPDTRNFRQEPAPETLPFERYVLALGRAVEKKGFDLLLRAYTQLGPPEKVGLVIGGDGAALSTLRELVAELGIAGRVHFPGRLERARAAELMRGADVFVMPSRLEPFGIVVLEAWREGTAVVASNRGGPPEFVEDGVDGLLVDPFDTSALAKMIGSLLEDPVRRAEIARKGREKVAAFSWPVIAQQYREIYREATRSAAGVGASRQARRRLTPDTPPRSSLSGRHARQVGAPMRVLRVSHSAVVADWRERERELARRGAQVSVVCAAAWEEGGKRVLFDPAGDDFAVAVRTLGRHQAVFVYDPRPLWRLLDPAHVDLVDIHEEPFSLAAAEVLILRALRRLHAPFVVYSAQNLDKRYPPPFGWIERWVLWRAGGAYVCNHPAGERLRRRGLRGELIELPLGVGTARFRASPRSSPSGPLRVGYVGRLTWQKGVGVLLDAIAGLDGWQVVLVGDGPDRQALVAQAAALRISERALFVGHLGDEALAERYQALDVLVVPSLTTPSWVEQFGRVAVEAMASGVPVIASDSGALPDVIGDAGILVPEGDPSALRAALEDLSRDPERWLTLQGAGLRRAERYSWSAVAEAHMAFYRRVLK